MELDLSEAYDEADAALSDMVPEAGHRSDVSSAAVDAAVVPILEALRARAQAETQRHYDPEDDVDVLVPVEEWLADLIEEVREHEARPE